MTTALLEHPYREKYPNQRVYEIDVDGQIHNVAVVTDGSTLVLKTIYSSRKATRKSTKGGSE